MSEASLRTAVDELAASVHHLDDVLGILGDKLIPVLLPAYPSPGSPEADVVPAEVSDLRGQVDNIGQHVMRLARRVADATSRADL